MGWIPPNAKWYRAEIVEEITVEDDPRNVVHTNMVLIRADTPEEAYEKSIALGLEGELSYKNPDGKLVTFRFRGLRDLTVIHGELEHGTELIYSEHIGMDEEVIKNWITPREELGVFAPIEPSTGPDYRSAEIVEEMERLTRKPPTVRDK